MLKNDREHMYGCFSRLGVDGLERKEEKKLNERREIMEGEK